MVRFSLLARGLGCALVGCLWGSTCLSADALSAGSVSADSGQKAESSAASSAGLAAVQSEPPERPLPARVLFIVSREHPACERELARLRQPGGEFDKLRLRGWKIGTTPDSHLQIVDRERVPELVEKLNVREFPTVAGVRGGQIVRSFQAGCTTPLDAWTFGFLAKGVDERPPGAVLEVARVAWTGKYPLRGNHWSIDGDFSPSRETLLGHLRGPVHGPQIRANWDLENWSYEELRSVHDNLHEQEMGGVSYASHSAPRSSDQFSATRKALGR